MPIQWEPSLSVGDKTIDEQHKRLLSTINDLLEGMASGEVKEKVEEVVKFLDKYIKEHLSFEEKFMQEHGYPEFDLHKKIHEGFIKNYNIFKEELESEGPSITLSIKVQRFIGQWWLDHIRNVDNKYYVYLKENPKSHPEDEGKYYHEIMQKL